MSSPYQDPNLVIPETIDREDVVWYDAAKAPFRIYGLLPKQENDVFRRMPDEIAKEVSVGVRSLACNTAGGRVRFSTDSPFIAVSLDWGCVPHHHNHFARSGEAGADLYRNEKTAEGLRSSYAGTFLPPAGNGSRTAYASLVNVGEGGMRSYTLNLPLYAPVKSLCVGIRQGCSLGAGEAYRNELPVVYYGSSITQGGCTSRPGCCYQGLISQKMNLDYINLGFSGAAKGEPAMADYLASLPMSVFVCDYDHNAPSLDHLKNTLPSLYQKIRNAHPDLPYIFMSGPRYSESTGARERRDFIAECCRHAREDLGDRNVCFVDGMAIMDGDFKDACSVDGCHPNDLGFYRMAQALLPIMEGLIKA